MTGAELQALVDAAGERYSARAGRVRRSQFRSVRAVLCWAWFGRDEVPGEVVAPGPGGVALTEALRLHPGVSVRGTGAGVLPAEAARRVLRDSRPGRRGRWLRWRLLSLLPARRAE